MGGGFVGLNEIIINEINYLVKNSTKDTLYRKALIGFASANDSNFKELRQIAAPNHFLPSDLLTTAKSVISFFLPFREDLITRNRNHDYVSKEWAIAYIETNELIDEIITHMKEFLSDYGIKMSDNPARMDFDKEILMHRWSQRHVARICGLGTFGINNMLITSSGCAGRYGSFVIDTPLKYNHIIKDEYCLNKKYGSCRVCIDSCPVNALTLDSFDRHKCYEWLKKVNEYYSDLDLCDCCGKCITVPCAFKIP